MTELLKQLAVVLDLGFGVFPCRAETKDKDHKSKAPLTKHGKDDASRDPAQIVAWGLKHKGCAWGARPPSGTTVLDIDCKEADGFATLTDLECQHGALPRTLTSRTPTNRGEHRVFLTPGHDYANRAGIRPGLDVRSKDGYIIIPPSVITEGPYEWIDHSPLAVAPEWVKREVFAFKTPAASKLTGPIGVGGRNPVLWVYACSLRARGMPEPLARESFFLRAQDCVPPLERLELDSIFERAWSYPEGFNPTDHGNAMRLVAQHGQDWRHLSELGWMRFDGVRWVPDVSNTVMIVSADVAKSIYTEALSVPAEEGDRRKALIHWAVKSESRRSLEAMSQLAQPYLADLFALYDSDPGLVAVDNGVLDLETGALRAAKREDRLRLKADVTYDPAATCPRWELFLREIFESPELIAYVQRAAGYSMYGRNDERKLFFAYGGGRNGKSTLLEVLSHILGDYAQAVPAETLMMKHGDGGVPSDVARMVGVRFGATVEVEDGRRLSESLVKRLTGKDKISARFMYKGWFDFVPIIKIWIATNHRPMIVGTDSAIWSRISLIPFTVTIPDDRLDKALKEKLLTERAGILNWMLEGFRAWRACGLAPPSDVTGATDKYRTDMDRVGEFLKERVTFDPAGWVRHTHLYAEYKRWCEAGGYLPLARLRFYDKLRDDHRLVYVARENYFVYDRMRLIPDNEGSAL
jgi:putative DNA primase/helicase